MAFREHTKGAFPPSHLSNTFADKLAYKVTSQTNFTHFCLVCQSEVCCKPNWFATNLTEATLRASLSASLLQKCDGGNAP
jgi:hypothetical protein